MSYQLISLILPVRDQAGHIERVVEAYARALSSLAIPHELLIVPNGCRDQSPALCDALAQRLPRTRVLHSERAGWGRAIRIGLAAAAGDLVGYTNSARTNPDELMRLVAQAIENPGVVVAASRQARDGIVRAAGSYLFNLECRTILHLSCHDVNATPKLFPRTCQRLFNLTRDDDLFDAEFHIVCRERRYPMMEFPIWSTRRHEGTSTMSLRSALGLFVSVLQLRQQPSAEDREDPRGQ